MTKAREIAELGQKLTVDASGNMEFAGDLELGDNNKAIFGAGSDLQIYHDGGNSYISDQGAGDLLIRSSNDLWLQNADGTETYARFDEGSSTYISYAGSTKLATTSTGVDVTGTLTSDGLTVDANVVTQATAIQLNGTSFADTERLSLDFSRGGNQGVRLSLEPDEAQINGDFIIETGGFGSTSDRLRIEANGDISFYEDTGSTAKFFWDASAERLGIGTSSPATELDVNGTTTSNQYLLDNIASTISDTAVDVFVYDTSKDSDGGAWRKRTQHTSWYNEAASSTRGSRKEFPAVAVIVAETNQVTIYDGDDPDLPMWMVFNGTSDYGSYLGRTSGANVTAVHMLNGILCVSRGNSGFGEALLKADFIKEFSVNYAVSGWLQLLPISGRNEGANSNVQLNYSGINPIVNIAVNDVAMTVLPNAPIDAATGLPVPTIAVATDGGVSVIKDDGTVVDITATTTGKVYYIDFRSSDNALVYAIGSSQAQCGWWNVYHQIPSSDVNEQHYYEGVYSDEMYSVLDNGYSGQDMTLPLGNTYDSSAEAIVGHVWGSETGFATLDPNRDAPSKGMIAYTASAYATGWMNGDIKLATLSDTDDTDVTGSELVTNGTFDSDISGWTDYSGAPSSISYSNGTMYLDGNSAYARATQTISTVVGKTYTFTLTASGLSSETFQMWVGTYGVYSSDTANKTFSDNGVSSLTFTATTTTTYITVFTGYRFYIDNVSVRLAEEDRSVSGNGLQVFGSITKDPVASGADLVAYSGFSASNYLQQPYNADLDFGTGNFTYAVWFYINSDTTHGNFIFSRRQDSGGNGFALYVGGAGDHTIRFQTSDGTTSTKTSTQTVKSGQWNLIVASRINATNLQISVNGQQPEYLDTESRNVNVANGTPLHVGINYNLSATSNVEGSIALARISTTVPPPEQIAKIYEDEKHLFQTGAQATLYGTSDAVTALAYDDSTELLHVGTSAGRSVFQGLRRVDNTTDAVGAAISASNGLVAED